MYLMGQRMRIEIVWKLVQEGLLKILKTQSQIHVPPIQLGSGFWTTDNFDHIQERNYRSHDELKRRIMRVFFSEKVKNTIKQHRGFGLKKS